jgi:hypothetical protein
MTGLVRKATLLTAAGLLAASAAMAGVPSAANSNVPACITLVGSAAGVPDVLGAFNVTVRDLANNPISGASVVIDLSGVTELSICNDQLDANALVVCLSKTTRKFTDGLGQVSFTVLGGGTFNGLMTLPGATGFGGGKIFANGTLIGSPTVAAYNLDGQGNVGGGDLAFFLADFVDPTPWGRSDFDCDNDIGGGDLAFWLTGFTGFGSLTYCTTTSCPSP